MRGEAGGGWGRERSRQGDRVLFSSVGLSEGFLCGEAGISELLVHEHLYIRLLRHERHARKRRLG